MSRTQDRPAWTCTCRPAQRGPGLRVQPTGTGRTFGSTSLHPARVPEARASRCSAGVSPRIQPFAPKHPPPELRRRPAEAVGEGGRSRWCSHFIPWWRPVRPPCWPFPQQALPGPARSAPPSTQEQRPRPPHRDHTPHQARHGPSPSRRLSAAGPSCWHFYVTSTLFTMPLFARGRGEGGGQQALVLAEESLPQGGRSWAPACGGRHSVRQRVVQRKQRRGRQTGGPCPQMKLEFVPAGAHMPGSRLPPGTLNSEPGCSRSKALQSPGSCHGTSDGREERRA